MLLGDCTDREEAAADGLISFSVNGHKELCAIHKPGGVSVSVRTVLQATALASARAAVLHQLLAESLRALEDQVRADRTSRLELLRKVHQLGLRSAVASDSGPSVGVANASKPGGPRAGVDRDDPMLQWASLHSAHTSS